MAYGNRLTHWRIAYSTWFGIESMKVYEGKSGKRCRKTEVGTFLELAYQALQIIIVNQATMEQGSNQHQHHRLLPAETSSKRVFPAWQAYSKQRKKRCNLSWRPMQLWFTMNWLDLVDFSSTCSCLSSRRIICWRQAEIPSLLTRPRCSCYWLS